jgi:hypothetical protein
MFHACKILSCDFFVTFLAQKCFTRSKNLLISAVGREPTPGEKAETFYHSLKIALMLVRLDHVASFILNADDGIMAWILQQLGWQLGQPFGPGWSLFFLSLLAGGFLGLIFGLFDLGVGYLPRDSVDLDFGDVLCAGLRYIERPNQSSVLPLNLFALDGAVRNLGKGRLFGVSF